MQLAAPAALHEPSAQATGVLVPGEEQRVPATHGAHADWPGRAVNEPESHGAHSVAPAAAKEPGAQITGSTVVVAHAYPLEQSVHALEPANANCPAVHGVAAVLPT